MTIHPPLEIEEVVLVEDTSDGIVCLVAVHQYFIFLSLRLRAHGPRLEVGVYGLNRSVAC